MGLIDVMHNAVERNITRLIIRKGYPVLPNGQINETLVEHGYAYSAWKDSHAERHIKGGTALNNDSKWEEVAGCSWNVDDFAVTKDGLTADHKGNITLEATGLSCICGQYTRMNLRYIAPLERVTKELNSLILESVLSEASVSIAA